MLCKTTSMRSSIRCVASHLECEDYILLEYIFRVGTLLLPDRKKKSRWRALHKTVTAEEGAASDRFYHFALT